MFHRVKSEPAQDSRASNPQTPVSQNPAPTQYVSAKDDVRLSDARPAQQVQAEQNNQQSTPAKTANSTTPKKEEAPTMNDQAKKPEAAAQESAPRALEIPGSSAYQRPGQPPVRAAGTFPGSYAGYNPHAAAAGAAVSTDRRLIIGRGITMSGEIESCDHLVVEGTVEATLKGASVLDIAESGVFYGTVEIDEATVAGRFEGDLQVKGRLTIRSGGAIKGSITYKELEVEAGATIDGRLSPVGAEHDAKKSQPRKRKDSHEAANSDGELFGKAAAE